jgi:hypothetical protein
MKNYSKSLVLASLLELFLLRIYNVSQIGFDFGLFSQKRCVGTFIVSVRNDRKRETTILILLDGYKHNCRKRTICNSFCLWTTRTKSDLSRGIGYIGGCRFWYGCIWEFPKETKTVSRLLSLMVVRTLEIRSSVRWITKLNADCHNALIQQERKTKEQRVPSLWYTRPIMRRNTIPVSIKKVKFWVGRWPKCTATILGKKAGKYDIYKPADSEWQKDKQPTNDA